MRDIYKKIFYCILLFIFLCLLCKYLSPYFPLIFIVIVLFYIVKFIYTWLLKIKIISSKISALISILIVNLIIFLFIFEISNIIIANIGSIYDGFIYIMNLYDGLCVKLLGRFNLQSIIRNMFSGLETGIMYKKIIARGAISTTDFLISYGLGNIVVYFLIVDKDSIYKVLFKIFNKKIVENIKLKLQSIKQIIFIELKIMGIATCITIVCFYVFGINYALSLGIICGVLDILPFVGTIFIFLPLILYKFFIKNYIVGMGLIILYFFILVLRKILETKFLGNSFHIHPLVILIFMYIFVKNIGVIGVIMAPLYVLMSKEIFNL